MERQKCPNCEKSFEMKSNRQIYCSKKCWDEYNKKDMQEYKKRYYQENKGKQLQKEKEKRLKRKNNGLCPDCNGERIDKKYVYCEKCRENSRKWNKKNPNEIKKNKLNFDKRNPNYNHKYYLKNQKLLRKRNDEWAKRNYKRWKELRRKQQTKYSKKYPEKIKAHNIANNKIKILIEQLCEICNENLATEKHHPDYNKPLEVQFLCSSCHTKLHRELKGECENLICQ